MSARGRLLPGGGVALPPDSISAQFQSQGGGHLLPLDPKHKAIILYYLFFAEMATSTNTNQTETMALLCYPYFAASVFCEKAYHVKIHPDIIREYHREVIGTVKKAGLKWDHFAVAQILSCQVRDQKTYDEVTPFLSNHRNASPDSSLSICSFCIFSQLAPGQGLA